MQLESSSATTAPTLQKWLSIEQREALLELGSRGPGARVDHQAIADLVTAGMIEVDDALRTVLTARGEMAYAYLTASNEAGNSLH